MDGEIKPKVLSCTEDSPTVAKVDETLINCSKQQLSKTSVNVSDEANAIGSQNVKLPQEKSDSSNSTDESTEPCKNALIADNNENNLAENTSESVSPCSSSVICNTEAGVIPVIDSNAEYRNKRNFSEDSDDDSDSWEDEDSDSSSNSSSSSDDSSSSSSTISSSSLASGEDSDFDIFNNKGSGNYGPPRTKGELTLDDLPPIEDLHITVPRTECLEIGKITSIVEQLVVIQAYKDTPALDLDSVLFLKEGDQMLGHVFDVFGPVKEPCYCVRFNSLQHINEHGAKVGMKVYCAPNLQEHSHFVFLSELLRQKGCDASWEHNNEPPPNVVEYSDDEEERNARKLAKIQRKQGKGEQDDELNKKHQTYEQRMNARNLRMSEKHLNRFNKGEERKTALTSPASAPRNQMQKFAQLPGKAGGAYPGIPRNFRPWGQGPGQVRQQSGPWRTGPPRHISPPQTNSTHIGPSGFVRPPAFSMPKYLQCPPAPFVPFPTTLLQNNQNPQPGFDTSLPPPPLSQAPCSVDRGIQMFPEQSHAGQQLHLARSGSVPKGLHLTTVEHFHQGSSQIPCAPPLLYRSESMPSVLPTLQAPSFFVRPDTTKPPPSMSGMMPYQFGSTTFGNPVAFSNFSPQSSRPVYSNHPPMSSPLLLSAPPPPPGTTSQNPANQIQQNKTNYSYNT